MEETTNRRTPEDCGFDRETMKKQWMMFYEEELNDPEQRALYLDRVEVHVEQFWAQDCTEIFGERICTSWSIEATFLQWLKLYLNRGRDFEEAWFLAIKALTKTTENRGVKYEHLDELADEFGEEIWEQYEQSMEWYLDENICQPRIKVWNERLLDFGINQDKAKEMAEELITLLREISFEQRICPTEFSVMSEEAMNQNQAYWDRGHCLRGFPNRFYNRRETLEIHGSLAGCKAECKEQRKRVNDHV